LDVYRLFSFAIRLPPISTGLTSGCISPCSRQLTNPVNAEWSPGPASLQLTISSSYYYFEVGRYIPEEEEKLMKKIKVWSRH